jgi:peptidoglycan hydrolase-like protein with peptidoglycan-binding domain
MRLHTALIFCLSGAATLACAPASAQTPAAKAGSPATSAAPDPGYDIAKRAFDALPEAERRGIQDALIWTGDYKGIVDGGFGRATRASIVAYEKRANLATDGVLDDKARAALAATAASAKAAAGFAPAHDERSGADLAVPLKILTKRVDTRTGSRWTAASGPSSLETSRTSEADGELNAQFDKLKDSTPARRVTYKFSRPDFFVVSGESGGNAFYTRVARGAGATGPELRGFTIVYPLGAKNMEAIAIALANVFNPFPGAKPATPVAAAPQPSPGGPAIAVATPAPQPIAPTRRQTVVATAVNLGGDRAVSSIGACDEPMIGGKPARQAKRDDKTGLALFETPGLGGEAFGAPASGATEGPALAFFIPANAPRANNVALAPGELVGGGARVLAPVDENGPGGLVFDRHGALAGIVGQRVAPTRVAGVTPQAAWPLISTAMLSAFIAPASLPTGARWDAPATADIAARAAKSLTTLSCLR